MLLHVCLGSTYKPILTWLIFFLFVFSFSSLSRTFRISHEEFMRYLLRFVSVFFSCCNCLDCLVMVKTFRVDLQLCPSSLQGDHGQF